MLEEIKYRTNEILHSKEETINLSQNDIDRINKTHQEEINKLKDKIQEKSKKIKFYYYSLLGINAILVFIYLYNSKSTDEQIKNQIDRSTFKATKLSNDSWLFKSQPRSSCNKVLNN